ncbi:MAG: PEP-CTERM sorting domain-containing protein [Candidatus Acidiferrales bacterium]
MKRALLVLVLAAFGTALPAAAGAVNVQLTGVGGANQGGVYVAPYDLSINGGTSIGMICDDFSHDVTVGETWTANINTFANLSNTRFGASDTQEYDEAAWLYTQYMASPSQAGDINFALWALFTPSTKTSGGYDAGAATWYSNAVNWYTAGGANSFDFSHFEIITPTNLDGQDSPQEYLYYNPSPTPTPEPSSLLLFGTGLLGLCGLLRKRVRSGCSPS